MKRLTTLSFLFLFLTNNLCSQVETDTTRERFIFDTSGYFNSHKRLFETKREYPKFDYNTIDQKRYQDTSMLDSTHYNYDFDYLYGSDEIDSEDTMEYDTTSFNRYYQSKTISSFDLYFGSKVFNSSFYNLFNTIDHIRLFSPIYEVGLGFSARMVVGSGSRYDAGIPHDGHWTYHTIIPIQISINDSINSKLTGSTISFSFGKDLCYLINNFDFVISGGIDLGRLMLSNSNYKYMKNPFFNPTISVQPKVKIKHFVISLRVDAWNDISNARWKQALVTRFSDRQTYDLTNYRQSGMRFLVGIGYTFK